ncbi:maturin isoform X2 [Zalophus californianus]|uniref:Maturin n=1 Tax=Zalophus californianus TaxID=9704 RepID=A0A6J2BEN3_ZALCA|nr:maturin isoform X2 [Zalophus californianus]
MHRVRLFKKREKERKKKKKERKKKGGGGEPRSPPCPARRKPCRPRGAGREAGRGGAGRAAAPSRPPPTPYTQHVNSPRREEPRDRREPRRPAPPPAREPAELRAARPGGGRPRREEGGRAAEGAGGGRRARRLSERRARRARMDFQQLADVAEKWCSNTPFELIATEETERRMDFYADPGVSFYVLCPDNGCGDNFLLGLPDADDDAFEEYSADVEEEEPEADHPQMGVSQQ